jgi:Adenylate and Guanylate cyclase catalytic domain
MFAHSRTVDIFAYKHESSSSGSEGSKDGVSSNYDDHNPEGDVSKQEEQDSPMAIVKRESQVITLFRCLLIIVLLLAAAATVTSVYLYTSSSEKNKFKSEYEILSATLLSKLFLDLRANYWIAHTISRSITLSLTVAGKPQTNFTMPRPVWEGVTEEARWIAGSPVISWIPFLFNDEERKTFEAHVLEENGNGDAGAGTYPICHMCGGNPDLIVEDESAAILNGGMSVTCGEAYYATRNGALPESYCPLVTSAAEPFCPCVKRNSDEDTAVANTTRTYGQGLYRLSASGEAVDQEFGHAPYAPMYSVASSFQKRRPSLFNVFSDPFRGRALNAVLTNGKGVLSEMRVRTDPYFVYTEDTVGEVGDVSSDLYYPVFSYDSAAPRVVGAVGIEFLWSNIVSGALPALSSLVTLVIENTCGQAHTYRIGEADLALQGYEDLHDPKYTDWARSSLYEDYDKLLSSNGGTNDAEYCLYRFRVHPTQELENMYYTKAPLYYAAACGAIFLFASIVFIVYDLMVRRRQIKVMASAKRTNNIVSSLFPQNVRERLYERQEANDAAQKNENAHDEDPLSTTTKGAKTNFSGNVFGSDPIVDSFPQTTVMFLDIAGFTKWSSERDPTQVFTLLENIYHAFDEFAKKLGIFKVETIGDCYVAVAGLPTPRKDHAVGKRTIGTHRHLANLHPDSFC